MKERTLGGVYVNVNHPRLTAPFTICVDQIWMATAARGGCVRGGGPGVSQLRVLGFVMALALAAPAAAISFDEPAPRYHWECVPYARAISGVRIFGDAHTWWDQADGRYRRGNTPRPGAVMAFIPHGNMRLGHVATVSEIIDERTLLITHANWSPIGGRRGQIERDVKVIDVSPFNDWTAVRVWYGPNEALGGTAWPVHGFIYPGKKPVPAKPTTLPKLQYANVLKWAEPSGVRAVRADEPRPTGRLAYLGATLSKLR